MINSYFRNRPVAFALHCPRPSCPHILVDVTEIRGSKGWRTRNTLEQSESTPEARQHLMTMPRKRDCQKRKPETVYVPRASSKVCCLNLGF